MEQIPKTYWFATIQLDKNHTLGLTFWSNILNTPSNSTSHYDKMSVKKSLTIVKIFLPDSTIIYVKQ